MNILQRYPTPAIPLPFQFFIFGGIALLLFYSVVSRFLCIGVEPMSLVVHCFGVHDRIGNMRSIYRRFDSNFLLGLGLAADFLILRMFW